MWTSGLPDISEVELIFENVSKVSNTIKRSANVSDILLKIVDDHPNFNPLFEAKNEYHCYCN